MAGFIHHTAEVSDQAQIGDETKIWSMVQIREGSMIGRGCNVGRNVYIDTDVKIGNRVKIQNNVNVYRGVVVEDDVFLGPSMTFTNDFYPRSFNDDWKVTPTLIRKGASLGANVTVVCGHTIGEYAMVGSGSVVTRDVADYALVAGNPAKQIGWVCRCGHRLDKEFRCPACGIQYKNLEGLC